MTKESLYPESQIKDQHEKSKKISILESLIPIIVLVCLLSYNVFENNVDNNINLWRYI